MTEEEIYARKPASMRTYTLIFSCLLLLLHLTLCLLLLLSHLRCSFWSMWICVISPIHLVVLHGTGIQVSQHMPACRHSAHRLGTVSSLETLCLTLTPLQATKVDSTGSQLQGCTGVLTVFAHHRFANQSDGGRIIPSSLFARLANQYFGISEQSVTNKSFRNTRLSGRLHYEP